MKENILTVIVLSKYVISLIMFIMIVNVMFNSVTDDLYVESLKVQDKSALGLIFQYFLIAVISNIISEIAHKISFSGNKNQTTTSITSPEDNEVDRKIEETEKRLKDLKTKLQNEKNKSEGNENE